MRHIPVGVKEDSTLQSYLIDHFNPDNFGFKDYSQEGVAVSFKEILYDAKKKIALVHVIACDGPLAQNIRIVIAHSPKGWRVNLAEGTMLMPTMAVSQALECVYQAAKNVACIRARLILEIVENSALSPIICYIAGYVEILSCISYCHFDRHFDCS